MQVRGVMAIAIGISALAATPVHSADKSALAGNTGLSINSSGRLNLVTSVPIDYRNRSVANGRRVVNLRIAQPLLCADFAAAPGAGSNPVAFEYLDPNGESSGLLYGGIGSYDYLTNGGAASLLSITTDSRLACCVMLPAANANCFQGVVGSGGGVGLFEDGFESPVAGVAGGAADLAVSVGGPATVAPGVTFNYTITVTNVGGISVSSVRVRDWFPKASGGFPASLANGTWTCTPSGGASCGVANGSGNLSLNSVSLDPGASVSISAARTMSAGAPTGTPFSVSAAAFAPPSAAEEALGNNQDALSASVQQISYTVTPSTLSFNGIIGVPTATQNVSIAAPAVNAGNVVINGCTFGGPAAGDFQFSPVPSFAINVAPGASVSLPVRMVATAVGSRSATLTCTTTNVPGQPSFTVTLNGTATDTAPTISDIGNQNTLEDVATGSIAFTASDAESVLTTSSLSCSSTNNALVDSSRCTFGGAEPNFTLVVSPKANANGSATVTVTVTDGSTPATDTFVYTVTAVNDAPDFTLANNRVYTTSGLKVVGDFATALVPGGGIDEASQAVTVVSVILQSGASLFAPGGEPVYDSGKNILSFQLNGTAGVATVRVRVQDNGINGGPNGDVNFREKDFTITFLAAD